MQKARLAPTTWGGVFLFERAGVCGDPLVANEVVAHSCEMSEWQALRCDARLEVHASPFRRSRRPAARLFPPAGSAAACLHLHSLGIQCRARHSRSARLRCLWFESSSSHSSSPSLRMRRAQRNNLYVCFPAVSALLMPSVLLYLLSFKYPFRHFEIHSSDRAPARARSIHQGRTGGHTGFGCFCRRAAAAVGSTADCGRTQKV